MLKKFAVENCFEFKGQVFVVGVGCSYRVSRNGGKWNAGIRRWTLSGWWLKSFFKYLLIIFVKFDFMYQLKKGIFLKFKLEFFILLKLIFMERKKFEMYQIFYRENSKENTIMLVQCSTSYFWIVDQYQLNSILRMRLQTYFNFFFICFWFE